jgi:quinol monooxygenase YgiN
MLTTGLYVRLEAKPGKEKEVETFLRGALPLVEGEPETTAWFALRMGPAVFGIFDVFQDDRGRQAHLSGKVAAALQARAAELFANAPSIEKLDIVASKLPSMVSA